MNKKNLAYFITIAVTTLIAIFLASRRLSQPGLYYDELLFASGTLASKTDNFIFLKFQGIPIFLMEYIGAIKAWLYYPIFLIFSVNYWSVRFPSILIGITGGLFLVAALWRGFGRNTAIVGSIMILVDPTLLINSRLDWGPNAFMFLFRGLMIFAVISYVKTKNLKWAWWSIAIAFLGIYDKLNFLWFVTAITGAIVIVYYKPLKEAISADPARFKSILVTAILLLGLSIWRAANVAQYVDISWTQRISNSISLIRLTLPGGGALDFVSGDGFRNEHFFWPGYVVIILVALAGLTVLQKKKNEWQLFLFGILTLGLVTVAFIATKSATGPHHSSMLSGFWQFTLAPLIGIMLDEKQMRFKFLKNSIITIGLLLVFIGSVVTNIVCVNAFAIPTNKNWDRANDTAALFSKQYPSAYFITADWGMGKQIIAATKGDANLIDFWPDFTRIEGAEKVILNMKRNKDTYIYTRLAPFETFTGNHNNLLNALNKYNIHYKIVQTYNNTLGQPMIQILLVPKN